MNGMGACRYVMKCEHDNLFGFSRIMSSWAFVRHRLEFLFPSGFCRGLCSDHSFGRSEFRSFRTDMTPGIFVVRCSEHRSKEANCASKDYC